MEAGALERATRLAQGPDPEAAHGLIAAALAQRPEDPDALTLLGVVSQRRGDRGVAIDAFARACAAEPDNPARLNNHGVALKQANRFEDAIAAFARSLALRPGAPATLANLGSCLIAASREDEAESPLREAIAAKPDHVEAWNNLGVALARGGRKPEAVTAYRRALLLRPGYVEAALNLVDALGDGDERLALASRVAQACPDNVRAANLVAAELDRRGDLAGAIATYRQAFARAPNPAIGINLAMALLRSNQAGEALALTDRLLVLSPHVTTPLALKCVALERLGETRMLDDIMALDRFVKVIDLDADPAFHVSLDAELRAHPSLTFEPEGLVTRAGRQSGDLAAAATPALAQLAALARHHLAMRHAALTGGDHPWLAARTDDWSLTMWGTILQPGGAVEPHIHAPNWLSGVYYPALPKAIDRDEEGGFAIGVFPEALGGGGFSRTYAARSGRMILFPSWLWHATMPFGGEADRISLAFDLVPDGIGQPHRLKK